MINIDDKLKEECAVFGIRTVGDPDSEQATDVVNSVYMGLFALQHRGQESCGIAVNNKGLISGYKGEGLVSQVFTRDAIEKMPRGNMAIGHCRYSMTNGNTRINAQPLVVRHIKGSMALAYNGNITNARQIKEELELGGAIFHTTGNAEVIAYVITRERLTSSSIEEAISRSMNVLQGAYSMVIMSPKKLIAVRDPLGFRPLCIGKRGNDYIIASESCAMDSLGAEFLRDVIPGEIVIIDENGMTSNTEHCHNGKKAACVFEFIYFARPDSVIDGSCVHTARQRAGAYLSLEHPVQADVVIGVPDSGIDAALGYAKQSGIPYDVGFIKNKYIGRTFIEPFENQRETSLNIKLNVIKSTVKGKRVVLIDDSIVRGSTSKRIVKQLREAGAKEVHMRVSSPPFLYPCYFGTDIKSRENLIAAKHSLEEIKEMIGVDSLGFLDVDDVTKIAVNPGLEFCTACYTGNYPIDIPEVKGDKYEQEL